MRVKPTGGGAPPVSGSTEATGPSGPTAADGVASTTGPAEIASTAKAAATDATDPIADVANRLRAGEISPREAVELLIDDAVRRQVGHATSNRARLGNELKELLRRYTETDPYLASKVRRLGKTR